MEIRIKRSKLNEMIKEEAKKLKLLNEKMDDNQVVELAKKEKQNLLVLLSKAEKGEKISKSDFNTWIGDISNLINYYNLVITKDFKGAEKKQYNMDSGSRELINTKIYNFVQRNEK